MSFANKRDGTFSSPRAKVHGSPDTGRDCGEGQAAGLCMHGLGYTPTLTVSDEDLRRSDSPFGPLPLHHLGPLFH
eukprot:5631504-Pyramimonas_sp.AAC.2